MKAFAYWVIILFGMGLVGNVVSFLVLGEGLFGGALLGLISLVVVYLLLRNDFSRRYKQIRALDNLLWELRWFSVELRRVEF